MILLKSWIFSRRTYGTGKSARGNMFSIIIYTCLASGMFLHFFCFMMWKMLEHLFLIMIRYANLWLLGLLMQLTLPGRWASFSWPFFSWYSYAFWSPNCHIMVCFCCLIIYLGNSGGCRCCYCSRRWWNSSWGGVPLTFKQIHACFNVANSNSRFSPWLHCIITSI